MSNDRTQDKDYEQLNVRLYRGQDDDLIAWLDTLRDGREAMAPRIRDVLRRGIASTDTPSTDELYRTMERACTVALSAAGLVKES